MKKVVNLVFIILSFFNGYSKSGAKLQIIFGNQHFVRQKDFKKVIIPLKFGQSKKNTDICPRYETSEGHEDREMASRITKEEEK